jgi:hypothetical protein
MGPTDHEEAAQNIQAQRHEAFFPRVRIVSGKSVRILKHRSCVCEVDPVLLSIGRSLVGIPLVRHPRQCMHICTRRQTKAPWTADTRPDGRG